MAGKPAKADKEAKKAAKREKRAASRMRYKQLWQAFQHQRREDKLLLPLMIGSIVLASALAFGIGLFFGMEWVLLPLGIAIGLLVAVSIFGRRVQSSVYSKADGQPGAAGWALDNMRGAWRVSQGIAGTTHLDAVHRVIGRPGVILVAEGAPAPGEVAARAGEEAHVTGGGQHPDLRLHRGQRGGPDPVCAIFRRRSPSSRATSRPTRWTTSRSASPRSVRAPRRCRRARCPRARRCAASSARCGGASAFAPPRCAPRGRASRGRRRRARAAAPPPRSTPCAGARETGPTALPPSTGATRRPSAVIPALAPNSATGTAVRTNQTPSTNHPNQGLTAGSGVANIAAMPYPMNQSIVRAASRRPNPATEPTPEAGRPSRSPG